MIKIPIKKEESVKKLSPGYWWNRIGQIALYALVFLAPLFFLPWTVFPVALNKQVLVIFLVVAAFVCWLLRSISSGHLIYRRSPLNIVIFCLLFLLGISAYFSIAPSQSIWGNLVETDSLIALSCYIFAFFLFGAFFRKKRDLVKLTLLFLIALTLLSIFSICQIAGLYIFPWSFSQLNSFNPVGTVFGLGVFLAFGLVMLLAMLDTLRPPLWLRIGLYILAGLIGAILILLNFWVIWIGLMVAMCLMVVSKILRKGVQAVRELSLPVIVLALAALLLIIRLPALGLVDLPFEISPSFSATLEIAKQNTQGFKEVALGSGPATFAYRYAFHRSQLLNQTAFWGVRFSQGLAALPTFLTTLGALGTGLLLLLLIGFVILGVRGARYLESKHRSTGESLLRNSEAELRDNAELRSATPAHSRVYSDTSKSGAMDLISGLFSGYLAGTVFLITIWFIYPLNFTLALFTFLGMAITLSALGRMKPGFDKLVETRFRQTVPSNSKAGAWRKIAMFATPQRSLPLFLLAVTLIVGLLASLYLVGQKYAAALYYHQGILAYNRDGDLDLAVNKLLQAVNLDSHQPRFLRTLDETLILRLQRVIGQSAVGKSEQELADLRAQFQNTLSLSIEAAQKAIRLNPNDSLNWINYGRLYENVMFLVEGANQQAIAGFQKAMSLEPENPQLPVNLARVYVVLADRFTQNIITLLQAVPQPGTEQEQQVQAQIQALQVARVQYLSQAQKILEDSLSLKPDYAPNHFLAVQVYERQAKIEEAIYRAENLALIQPLDSGTMFQLGMLYYKNNDNPRAQGAFERAVSLNEDYSNARYFLGLIYNWQGEKEKAIVQFEKIAQLNPENEEVQKILNNLRTGKEALKGISTLPAERTSIPLPVTGGRQPEIEKESELK